MGRSGPDLLLSREAQALFPYAVECKNTEKISFWACVEQAARHASLKQVNISPLLVFKKNRSPIYCAVNTTHWRNLSSRVVSNASCLLDGAIHRSFPLVPEASRPEAIAENTCPLSSLVGFRKEIDRLNIWRYLAEVELRSKPTCHLPYLELARCTTRSISLIKAHEFVSVLPFTTFLNVHVRALIGLRNCNSGNINT